MPMYEIVNRKYVREAIKRNCPRILPKEEIYVFAKEAPELASCSLVQYLNPTFENHLDDSERLKEHNRIFEGYFEDTVQIPAVSNVLPIHMRTTYAIFWFSVYFHYRAVADTEVVYSKLRYCLREKIIF